MATISGGYIISGGTLQPGGGTGTPITNAGAPSAGTNAVQTISATGTVSGGTFRVGYQGAYTPAQPFGVTNANLKTALDTLTGGTTTIGGGPLPASTTVTFGGGLAAQPVSLLSIDSSALTGGGSYGVANTTPGVNSSGRNAAGGAILKDITGNAYYKNTATPPAAPAWGSPVALMEALEADTEDEAESDTPKRSRKSVKGPPEDKAAEPEEEKSDDGA